MIVDAGVDGVNPIEPAAGMDIGEVKQKYGHRVCLIGNIDCSCLLPEGSVEEVEAAVKECIRKAAPGGGYIISSSNSIHSSVKPENYLAMIQATRKYGRYHACINGQ
jgi:uroporphyrinogen decarboxylase